MSSAGPGAPPPGSSALQFLAEARLAPPAPSAAAAPPPNLPAPPTGQQPSQAPQPSLVPAGVRALCEACERVYPAQPNPLQVTTRLKYWLGGTDPLDYISMYWNDGDPAQHVPPHWHYVSFGLSDLHGDGRVHPPPEDVPALGDVPRLPGDVPRPSGAGFELTFRLAAESRAVPPALWPAALLQALARYVFTTGNKLCAGDHVSWHAPLDATAPDCRLRHLLVASDPQLASEETPHGTVAFLQMVGCTGRELRAAQRGSGFEVLRAMARDPRCGGSWLVCSPPRARSARGLPRAAAAASLAGVSARVHWQSVETHQPQELSSDTPPGGGALSDRLQEQIKATLRRGLVGMSVDQTDDNSEDPTSPSASAAAELPSLLEAGCRLDGSLPPSPAPVTYPRAVHLFMDAEAASLLPLAVDGRVLQGRHFTWRGGHCDVTVLPERVPGALPTVERPYAVRGQWLQILLDRPLALEMSAAAARLARRDSSSDSEGGGPPRAAPVLAWPARGLALTVLP